MEEAGILVISFFQFMSEKSGNLGRVDVLFEKLADVTLKGRVIPVSLKSADLCFSTLSGKKYRGEHNLDDLRMSFGSSQEDVVGAEGKSE